MNCRCLACASATRSCRRRPTKCRLRRRRSRCRNFCTGSTLSTWWRSRLFRYNHRYFLGGIFISFQHLRLHFVVPKQLIACVGHWQFVSEKVSLVLVRDFLRPMLLPALLHSTDPRLAACATGVMRRLVERLEAPALHAGLVRFLLGVCLIYFYFDFIFFSDSSAVM